MELTRAQTQQYAAELIAAGKEASTVRLRLAALRQFADVQPLKNGVVGVRRGKGMKGPVARLSLTLMFCEDFHIFYSCRVTLNVRRLM